MEDCQYHKFGYCKYGSQCERKHHTDICDKRNKCKNKRNCAKRHPKPCQNYKRESFCTHGENCAYYHQSKGRDQNSDKMEKRIKYLEETVATLSVSLYTLQGQLFDLKYEVKDNTEVNENNVS